MVAGDSGMEGARPASEAMGGDGGNPGDATRPRGLFYEEFAVGMRSSTPARTITESDVVGFAGISGDWNPLHTDAEFARATPFGERIAHGLLGLTVASGLIASRLAILDGTALAFLGIEEWRFEHPITIGTTVHARLEVEAKRLSRSIPSGGIVSFQVEVVNQDERVNQRGRLTMLMRRRGGPPAPAAE